MKELTTPAFQKEIEEAKTESENKLKKEPFLKERKETIISSRDVEYFD